MHPAFSVIFFTTLSGLGYGIWMWTAAWAAFERHAAFMNLFVLLAAVVPVAIGLLSSTAHLGKPLRSWRAFSQWRTSWLSREGVLAMLAFVPWLVLASLMLFDDGNPVVDLIFPLMAALGVLALLTVVCTAMIYASLKPIPAWTHASVVPAYMGFALLTGGLASSALVAAKKVPNEPKALVLVLVAVGLLVLKRRYWRDIDRGHLPVSRASALGLPADRSASVFERPHTEANYLTREMGFVLARKHSHRLRALALTMFGAVPALACLAILLFPPLAQALFALAAVSALLGAVVERWLFFAEAKHLVTLYY
jgi:DMSO reductase anchor subunit